MSGDLKKFSDQIAILTYVLMDNFLPYFLTFKSRTNLVVPITIFLAIEKIYLAKSRNILCLKNSDIRVGSYKNDIMNSIYIPIGI